MEKTYEERYYQTEAVEAVIKAWNAGDKRCLVVLPTGTGKTVVFARVVERAIRKASRRVLVLAHRDTLLEQTERTLRDFGIETANEKGKKSVVGSETRVVISSVQTMAREKRLAKFPNDYFDVIVIDETHHVTSASYTRILNHFSNAYVLGVTATPDKAGDASLKSVFNKVTYEYTLERAVKDGFVCDIVAKMLSLKINLSKIRTKNRDFDERGLDMAIEPYLDRVAKEMKTHCAGRKTVVFLPLIDTAKKFAEILNRNGLRAVEVDGTTKNLSAVVTDFENDVYDVICNAQLLTEGWDCAAVDCVVILRPTQIQSFYQQMVGRGTRLHPGKKNLLLLDFLWLTDKHGLCRPANIFGENEVTAEMNALIENAKAPVSLTRARARANDELRRRKECNVAREIKRVANRRNKTVNAVEYRPTNPAWTFTSTAWREEAATAKQVSVLEKYGVENPSELTRGEAHDMLAVILDKKPTAASERQIVALRKYGFRGVERWTSKQAHAVIAKIADNGWKVPAGINPATYAPLALAAK